MKRIFFITGFVLISFLYSCNSTSKTKENSNGIKKQPNVIIVITDDQGYGDIGALGNTIVKTPAIDNFHEESVHLTDFHVAPTCAPTRSGLMTGRYANRVGVWHTIGGVSILRKNEITIAQVFKDNGYDTAMFGKWHLGDTYPSRPQDKGFNYTLVHGGGGISQTPDYWNNDYFDDTYFENGKPKKYEGYCTDVWFGEAIKYIEEKKEEPFFCYISANAPHGPFNVPQEYYDKYKDLEIPDVQKKFYGMITNIDDNFEKLENKLKDLDLFDNTIFIFMTDNGTSVGYRGVDGVKYGFNAGMRGTKNSEYEGGHRVPFFISYPNANIKGGKDISELTANLDVMPTLATLCNINLPELNIDGSDVSSVVLGKKKSINRDYLITDSQRMQEPVKWHKSAVMSGKLRLVNGEELYDISTDPGQKNDLAALKPEDLAKMRGYYNEWWTSVSSEFNQYPVIVVGSDKQNPVIVTCHDAHISDAKIPYNQNHIRDGIKNPFSSEFTLEFEQDGFYEITLSRWPFESGLAINDAVEGREGTLTTNAITDGQVMNLKKATLKIGAWKQTQEVYKDAKFVVFKGNFSKGKTTMTAWFTNVEGVNWGAFYISVKRMSTQQ